MKKLSLPQLFNKMITTHFQRLAKDEHYGYKQTNCLLHAAPGFSNQ